MLKVKLQDELKKLEETSIDSSTAFVDEVKLLLEGKSKEEVQVLKVIGLGNNIIKSEDQAKYRLEKEKLIKEYEGEVYSEEQVKHLAIKYKLKFLSTRHFNGHVSPDLGAILLRFKNKHNLTEWDLSDKFYILAPQKMFTLLEKHDPLLFYKVDNSHYKLVHKWGSDFTLYRRILGIIYETRISARLYFLASLCLFAFLFNKLLYPLTVHLYIPNTANTWVNTTLLVSFIVINILLGLVFLIGGLMVDNSTYYGSDKEWNNPHKR
jgi:hypothetical protein